MLLERVKISMKCYLICYHITVHVMHFKAIVFPMFVCFFLDCMTQSHCRQCIAYIFPALATTLGLGHRGICQMAKLS